MYICNIILYYILYLLYKQIKFLINISSKICLSYRATYNMSSKSQQLILIRKMAFLRLTLE